MVGREPIGDGMMGLEPWVSFLAGESYYWRDICEQNSTRSSLRLALLESSLWRGCRATRKRYCDLQQCGHPGRAANSSGQAQGSSAWGGKGARLEEGMKRRAPRCDGTMYLYFILLSGAWKQDQSLKPPAITDAKRRGSGILWRLGQALR